MSIVAGSQALSPSALRVSEAVGIEHRADLLGHLYFCAPPDYREAIPDDQARSQSDLEDFAMRLRIAFQKDEPTLFKEFFYRLLTSAQATFAPSGYRPQAMNDLATFKQEVVQTAGARIKGRYTAKLARYVLFASIAIVGITILVEWIAQNHFSLPQKGTGTVSSEAVPTIDPKQQSSVGVEGKAIPWKDGFSLSHTGILLAASMWGLLFASLTRNIDPTFETLLTPDADLMEPWVRLVFFGIPVLVISLMFQLRLVAISFGDVSTTQISENAVAAVLFGLLLGIAERALPKEVEQWSRKVLPSSQPSAR